MNLSSLAFNNYSFSYERSLSRKTTIVAGYRFMPETIASHMFASKELINSVMEDEGDDITDDLDNSLLANTTYTGEIRFYTGKKAGARGFYVSLYGRHMNLELAFPYDYTYNNNTYELPFDGRMTGFGGGVMFGAQWLIAKRVALDWYIIGAHYGKFNIDLPASVNLSTLSEAGRKDLTEELESVNGEIAGVDVMATVTSQGAHLTGKAPYIGVRGAGLSLGVAF
ncbi:MAG: DUF3575 domain-containing protein [Pontibacter sp.]|nr:DUF3575 domain-containing protein [Pontibacter sp.]